MDSFLEVAGTILIIIGLFFVFSAFIGAIRFKDTMSKLHAIGVSDVFGIPISLIGMGIKTCNLAVFFKYLLLAVIFLIASPIVTHNLAKFAYKEGEGNAECK